MISEQMEGQLLNKESLPTSDSNMLIGNWVMRLPKERRP